MASANLCLRYRNVIKYASATAALLSVAIIAPATSAQSASDDAANNAWQRGAIAHAQKMRAFPDTDAGNQPTPDEIPAFDTSFDPAGSIATVNRTGPTPTASNAFFQSLGTNDRTCFTCHQPQTGWTVSAQSVQARFYEI